MNWRKRITQELYKEARQKFPTCRVDLKDINDLYQADLVETIPYTKLNKGYKHIIK